ncbi:unnamed protein product, partial [Brassica oleracea var. botrytis]
ITITRTLENFSSYLSPSLPSVVFNPFVKIMNLEEKPTMASRALPQAENLYYVRCSICNTILAVGIPMKRMLDTVTVKCGHCGNLSFLTTTPPLQGHVSLTLQQMQSFDGSEYKKGSSSSSSSSTSSDQPPSPRPPFVVKPPEKKQRLPSAYNRFMRDEIQRIKSANPEIPHREAFSAAAKNVRQQSLLFTTRSNYIFTKFICITEICDKQWAKYIPNSPTSIASGASNIHVSYTNQLSLRTDI